MFIHGLKNVLVKNVKVFWKISVHISDPGLDFTIMIILISQPSKNCQKVNHYKVFFSSFDPIMRVQRKTYSTDL